MGGKDRAGVPKAEQETGLAEMVLTVIADMFQSSIPYGEIPWQGPAMEAGLFVEAHELWQWKP
jgi:hypothetical protein